MSKLKPRAKGIFRRLGQGFAARVFDFVVRANNVNPEKNEQRPYVEGTHLPAQVTELEVTAAQPEDGGSEARHAIDMRDQPVAEPRTDHLNHPGGEGHLGRMR